MQARLWRIVKNTLITLGAPVIVYLLFFGLTRLMGKQGFGIGPDLRVIIQNTVYSGFIALAVSYNLTSGRFDFSVGSVLILSVILGGTLATQAGFGPVGMVLTMAVVGMACGLMSGLLYVLVKLPPMITSLGLAMVFESLGFMLNSSKGIRLIGRFDLLIFAQFPNNLYLLGVALVILIYLLNFTQFGYNTNSLRTGQKNAVDVGVNEKKNAVICYVIAGALMACAGAVYLSQYGYLAPQTGLASISFIMGAFLPMFIGGSLAKYSDRNIGVIAGAFIQACISSGLVKLGVSSSVKTIIDGAIVLLFLVYVSNSHKLILKKLQAQKRALALSDAQA